MLELHSFNLHSGECTTDASQNHIKTCFCFFYRWMYFPYF